MGTETGGLSEGTADFEGESGWFEVSSWIAGKKGLPKTIIEQDLTNPVLWKALTTALPW